MKLETITYENLRKGANAGVFVFAATVAADDSSKSEDVAGMIASAAANYHTVQRRLYRLLLSETSPVTYSELAEVAEHLKSTDEDGRIMLVTGDSRYRAGYNSVDWLVWEGHIGDYPGFPVDELWVHLSSTEDTTTRIGFRSSQTPQVFISAAKEFPPKDLLGFVRANPLPWRLLTEAPYHIYKVIYEDSSRTEEAEE